MTNSNDAKAPPSSTEPQTLESGKNNTPNKHRHIITVVIILIAIACSIYTNLQLRQVTTQQINSLLSQINTLKQQQNDNETQIDSTMKVVNASQEKLHNKLNALDRSLQSAVQQRLYQTKDWLLLKARYCLELAQINAHWSDNTDTTVALLQQADALLADVRDQRSFLVRQAISKEITELQSMPKIDTAGLLSQLDAAQGVIANLELKPTIIAAEKDPTPKETSPAWRERLKESVGLLEKLVVVRRHDEDILPLPSPAYESMLREGIRLNLQEAQWAALQNNEAIYQFSLTQALKNINRAFDPNTAVTDTLIKQLQNLQQIHLIQKKPILEQSLPLLNQLIESKNTLLPVAGVTS
jgi:uroporphyrin-3 C-methyltransferase